MAAFEFTPGGVVPLVDRTNEGFINPAEAALVAQVQPEPVASAPARVAPAAHVVVVEAKPAPLKRREYTKELRARLKLVQREIAQLRALEDEEAEIQRLLAALKAPPGKVTDINSARKSG